VLADDREAPLPQVVGDHERSWNTCLLTSKLRY
jgi:hypothetical protein